MIFAYVVLAVLIGTLMPVQAVLNTQLTKLLGHPYLGAFISLATGTLAVGLLILIRGFTFTDIKRVSEVPIHLFLGGILGALFVGSSLFFIPKLGATAMIGAFITGQLLGSVLIDHFGLIGLPPTPLSLTRSMGVFLLFLGLFLIVKKNT